MCLYYVITYREYTGQIDWGVTLHHALDIHILHYHSYVLLWSPPLLLTVNPLAVVAGKYAISTTAGGPRPGFKFPLILYLSIRLRLARL